MSWDVLTAQAERVAAELVSRYAMDTYEQRCNLVALAYLMGQRDEVSRVAEQADEAHARTLALLERVL